MKPRRVRRASIYFTGLFLMLLTLPLVSAQTLFEFETGTDFVLTGVIIVLALWILAELARSIKGK